MPPRPTEQEVLALLDVAKQESEKNWLILRLIVEHGFKLGEIMGNKMHTAKLEGIRVEDLG